ncbi:MAG: dehydrogenase [Mycetocola sp.]
MAKKRPIEFTSPQLATALAEQDMVKVALALRNGRVVVPVITGASSKRGNYDEVWTFRSPESGELALLLFSDASHKPEQLPDTVALHDGKWLHEFLRAHGESLTTVFFDIAGPHPMQAAPAELLRVLDL